MLLTIGEGADVGMTGLRRSSMSWNFLPRSTSHHGRGRCIGLIVSHIRHRRHRRIHRIGHVGHAGPVAVVRVRADHIRRALGSHWHTLSTSMASIRSRVVGDVRCAGVHRLARGVVPVV